MDHDVLRRHVGVTALVTLASILVLVGATWAGVAAEHAENPPTCYGLGWGCTPDAGSSAFLVGLIVGVPVALTVATTLTIGMI